MTESRSPALRFDFTPDERLPRMAWCARLREGAGPVSVLHGAWVETGDGLFVEGAWDGPWEEGRFDQAVTFAGSGGRVTSDGVLFCAPSHNLEQLYAVRVGAQLYVSNSMVFLLVQSGDGLDLDHPGYFFDRLDHYRAGIRVPDKTLRTASGAAVRVFDGVDVLVRPDLSLQRVEKHFGSPPADFRALEAFLEGTVARVVRNAADPGRARPFPPLSSVSRGYDSAAVSVLAARAGCRQAVTFLRSGDRTGPFTRYAPDDGSEVARHLGLEVTAYERLAWRELPEPGPAELYPNVFFTTEVSTQVMESQVAGTLWMSGRHGEQFWDTDPVACRPWLEDPVSMCMAGVSSAEMRLRIGYVHLPVPYTLGVFAPDLNRISRSPEMAPWRLGGTYDRPIARRLLEEAGVPRASFGQTKMGGAGDAPEDLVLPARWEEDFLDFYHERVDPAIRSRLVDAQIGPVPYFVKGRMGNVEAWLRRRRGFRGAVRALLGDRRHQRWRSRYLYTFHWGFDRIRDRYDVPFEDAPAARPTRAGASHVPDVRSGVVGTDKESSRASPGT